MSKELSIEAYSVRVYMAGDITQAKVQLRKECFPPNKGLCVTIEPTSFIYTGVEESGFVIGFTNYPRFPCEPKVLWIRAENVARRLRIDLCQWTFLMTDGKETKWVTENPEH